MNKGNFCVFSFHTPSPWSTSRGPCISTAMGLSKNSFNIMLLLPHNPSLQVQFLNPSVARNIVGYCIYIPAFENVIYLWSETLRPLALNLDQSREKPIYKFFITLVFFCTGNWLIGSDFHSDNKAGTINIIPVSWLHSGTIMMPKERWLITSERKD